MIFTRMSKRMSNWSEKCVFLLLVVAHFLWYEPDINFYENWNRSNFLDWLGLLVTRFVFNFLNILSLLILIKRCWAHHQHLSLRDPIKIFLNANQSVSGINIAIYKLHKLTILKAFQTCKQNFPQIYLSFYRGNLKSNQKDGTKEVFKTEIKIKLKRGRGK